MENLPKDYFLDIDDELLNFLEKQGEDCIRELHQSNTVNKENSYKLLNILIVGIGSSFLLLTQKQPPIFLSAGMATFTLCWALCAIYLVFLWIVDTDTRFGIVFTASFVYGSL